MAKKRVEYNESDLMGKENLSLIKKCTKDYSGFSLDHLLIVVLGEMEALGIRLSEPNIAIAAWSMFPDKYSIFGWPDLPCSKRANTGILHIRYKTKRWITGTQNEYVITEKGRAVIEETKDLIETGRIKKQNYRSKTRKQEKLIVQAKKTSAYIKYTKKEEITQFDLYNLLQCTLDSSISVLRENYDYLMVLANESEDKEMLEFLNLIQKNFEELNHAKDKKRNNRPVRL